MVELCADQFVYEIRWIGGLTVENGCWKIALEFRTFIDVSLRELAEVPWASNLLALSVHDMGQDASISPASPRSP